MGEVTETVWVVESGVPPDPGRGLGTSSKVRVVAEGVELWSTCCVLRH